MKLLAWVTILTGLAMMFSGPPLIGIFLFLYGLGMGDEASLL